MKKIIFFIIAMFLLSTASISIAKFSIIPSVDLKEEYNDNIFLTESDREDDFITTAFPKVELKYYLNKYLDLDLDYGLRFNFYSRHDELNDTSIRETQNIKFKAQARPVNRIFIDISDRYERVPTDVRDSVAEGNVFFNMTDRNTFFVSPYTELPVTSTVSTRIGYSYSNMWHRDDGLVDYDRHSAFLFLNKRFSAKINGTLGYNYEVYRPESTEGRGNIEEYDRQRGYAGIVYRLNQNFEMSGEIGETWTDFDESDDSQNPFWNVEAAYSFGSSEIGTAYSYILDDSVTNGSYKKQRIDLRFETGKKLVLEINPYYETGKYLNADREDRITGVNLNISRSISEKIKAAFNGVLEELEFLPEGEDVIRYSAGISLDFMLSRSITAGLGYRYNRRDSDIDYTDFHNNIASLKAKLIF
ncbi:MAG: TIGR03016 family PEP-CTERM system-associated outer membrane protein [Nitrospirota bacterium]